jgi:hypothetical protein
VGIGHQLQELRSILGVPGHFLDRHRVQFRKVGTRCFGLRRHHFPIMTRFSRDFQTAVALADAARSGG